MAQSTVEIEVTRTPTPAANALMNFVALIVSQRSARADLDDPLKREQLIASAGLDPAMADLFRTEQVTGDKLKVGIAYNTQSSDPFLTSVNFVKK